jgi:hypothetical protein
MKRILVAAGVGLCLFTATTAMSSNVDHVQVTGDYNALLSDTTPKKDTSKPKPKPKPDSTSISYMPGR